MCTPAACITLRLMCAYTVACPLLRRLKLKDGEKTKCAVWSIRGTARVHDARNAPVVSGIDMGAVRRRLAGVPIHESAARLMNTIGSGQRGAGANAAAFASMLGSAGAMSPNGPGGGGMGGMGGAAGTGSMGAMGAMMAGAMSNPSLASAAMAFMQNMAPPQQPAAPGTGEAAPPKLARPGGAGGGSSGGGRAPPATSGGEAGGGPQGNHERAATGRGAVEQGGGGASSQSCPTCGCASSGSTRQGCGAGGIGGGSEAGSAHDHAGAHVHHDPGRFSLAQVDKLVQENLQVFRQQILQDVQQMHADLLRKILEQGASRERVSSASEQVDQVLVE